MQRNLGFQNLLAYLLDKQSIKKLNKFFKNEEEFIYLLLLSKSLCSQMLHA